MSNRRKPEKSSELVRLGRGRRSLVLGTAGTVGVLALCAALTAGTAQAVPATPSWSIDLTGKDTEQSNIAREGAAITVRDTRIKPASQRSTQAFALYTSSPVSSARPVGGVEVTTEARIPAGASVLTDVRGRNGTGRWTQWSEVSNGRARLDEPVATLQLRLTLVRGVGGSPAVSKVTMRPNQTQAYSESVPAAQRRREGAARITGATYRLFGTREGLVGGRTANGHIIQNRDHFVALPSRRMLASNGGREYTVQVCNGGRCVTEPVWDVGPWNTKDDYWSPASVRQMWKDLPQGKPEAQAAYQNGYNGGKDEFGRRPANPAGIDLADGTFWDSLGMRDNGWVDVTFGGGNGGAKYTVTAWDTANVRECSNRGCKVVSQVHPNQSYGADCYQVGERVTDGPYTNDKWIRLHGSGFVSAIYLKGDETAGVRDQC